MADRDAFLRAILADPADDLRRVVMADWLEENGETQRASHVRSQVELSRHVAAGAFDERYAGLTHPAAAYVEGDRVTVLYDPADPTEARLRSFASLWLLPLIQFVFAVVWMSAAVAAYFVDTAQ